MHDGVLKAPPVLRYCDVSTLNISHELATHKRILLDNHDHEQIYTTAKKLATEAVRIMQLASANIEANQQKIVPESKITSENIDEVSRNLIRLATREHDARKKAHTDMADEVKKTLVTNITTIEKMTPPPASNHPIAVLGIEHDKPVFAYVNRVMSGLDDAEDARKALAASEPDYCEEVRRFMIEYSKLNDLKMPPQRRQ
ncbi:MAG: hypothetical protein KAJ93_02485 [Methanosarcinales archaeon]|nr:hypothetical protein [Methanosarcinales archaeon]